MKRFLVALALVLACDKDVPTTPPPPPPPSAASLRAFLQDSMQLGGWHADSMHASVGDTVLTALPGQTSRCAVWRALAHGGSLRYVLYASYQGTTDSAWTEKKWPYTGVEHAWASIEEFYGPGYGPYAVIRSVAGECSTQVSP